MNKTELEFTRLFSSFETRMLEASKITKPGMQPYTGLLLHPPGTLSKYNRVRQMKLQLQYYHHGLYFRHKYGLDF